MSHRSNDSPIRRAILLVIWGTVCGAGFARVAAATEIRPSEKHPWYWEYDGQTVLLVGGSDDDNLFQWPADALRSQLDLLKSVGGNYIRNTMSDRQDRGHEVFPFLRLDNGKYDLNQWNPEYWSRFQRLLDWTHERDIIVQIEVWDRFDFTDNGGRNHWQRHPYRPANNNNYSASESGLGDRYPDHPGANKQPFFFTTPGQQNNETVLRYQQQFVDKLLSHSLRYPNILYCLDNETKAEETWATYWAAYIQRKAGEAGRALQITEMWDDWDLTAPRHRRTFDHPSRYSFVDISQNNHNKGDKHWENALWVRRYLQDHRRPVNSVKIYGADGNKFGHSDSDGVERFWRHLLAGCASARFHRPDSGLGLSEKAQACLRTARAVERLTPFWELEPRNDLLLDRALGEAYAASRDGANYVIYFPSAGSVRLAVSSGRYEFTRLESLSGKTLSRETRTVAVDTLPLESSGPHQVVVVRKR